MDRIGSYRPVGVRSPEVNGGTDSNFPSLNRLGPPRVDREPTHRPPEFEPDRLQNTILALPNFSTQQALMEPFHDSWGH
jgi:hypothetical protein